MPNPVTAANFDGMTDWQKRQFCQGRGAMTASAATDRRPGEMAATGDARTQLTGVETQARTAASVAGTGTAQNPTADPFADKCKDYMGPAPQTAGNPVTTPAGGTPPSPTNIAHGPDKEVPAKEKSKWFTQDLLTSGAKGAMVGLLVGSLFGPVGLIAGPILGGLLFYGLTKATSKD
ncbi:MAG: hypothetical protein M0D55_06420 [Elusimicrobiota bacterium]|nr:MAG: hypothetical protein M0D55_06420 [Elusimicrobiota bacterium]